MPTRIPNRSHRRRMLGRAALVAVVVGVLSSCGTTAANTELGFGRRADSGSPTTSDPAGNGADASAPDLQTPNTLVVSSSEGADPRRVDPASLPRPSIPGPPRPNIPAATPGSPTPPRAPGAPLPPSPPTTVGTAGRPERPPGPRPASERVVHVLGDSVLLAAKDTLPAELPTWDVTVDADVSRTIDQGIKILESRPPKVAAVVVVHLCTNYSAGGGFEGKLDKVLAMLQGHQIVLVTCTTWSPGQIEANGIIAEVARRRPDIRVADWAAISGRAGFTGGDRIHLLPPGRVAIAQLVATEVTR